MSVPRSRLLTVSEILVFGGILFALIAPLFSLESDSPSSQRSQLGVSSSPIPTMFLFHLQSHLIP